MSPSPTVPSASTRESFRRPLENERRGDATDLSWDYCPDLVPPPPPSSFPPRPLSILVNHCRTDWKVCPCQLPFSLAFSADPCFDPSFFPTPSSQHAIGPWNPKKPYVTGCDSVGSALKVGSDVKHIKEGDRVAGFVFGCSNEEQGAYSEGESIKHASSLLAVARRLYSD